MVDYEFFLDIQDSDRVTSAVNQENVLTESSNGRNNCKPVIGMSLRYTNSNRQTSGSGDGVLGRNLYED